MVDSEPENRQSDIDDNYDKAVAEIENRFTRSVELLDQKILYLAAGALGLSLNFVGELVELRTANLVAILMVSWFALTASIITSLFGYRFVTRASHKRNILDALDRGSGRPPYENVVPDPHGAIRTFNDEADSVDFFNSLSFWLLVVGLISMITFVSINIVVQLAEVSTPV